MNGEFCSINTTHFAILHVTVSSLLLKTLLGKRLGHGMGYYDKYLKSCFQTQSIKPYLVAVGFEEQIQEDIPTNEDDVPVDIVLTG